MLSLIALWLLLFAMLFGIGSAALRCAGRRIENVEDAFTAFWLGWTSIIAVNQIWNCFAPIGAIQLWSMAALGALGLAWNRGALGLAWSRARSQLMNPSRRTAMLVGASGLVLIWLANRAMGPITPQADAGIYHVTATRWLQTYPIVPGLENLGWLYNNSSFLFFAMLDFAPGPPHFFHLGHPLLMIVFSAQAWMYLVQVIDRREAIEGHRLLGCLWVACIVPYYFMDFASTSTDIVSLLLGLLLGIHLFKIVFEPIATREIGFNAALIVIYSAVGFSNKLSFLFLGAPACLIAAYQFVRSVQADGRAGVLRLLAPYRSAILLVILVAALILVPWLIRGYIYSGYVAYPSTSLFSIDVDWKAPEADMLHEKNIIRALARTPSRSLEALENWDWVIPWMGKTAQRADMITVPLLVFVIMGIAYAIRGRSTPQDPWAACRYVLPPLVSIYLWFITAPSDRYAGSVFWLLGAGMAAIYFQHAPSERAKQRLIRGYLGFVAVTVAATTIVSLTLSQQRYGWSLFVAPGPEAGFHPIPEVETRPYVTDSGLVLNTPVRVLNASSKWQAKAWCWDAPLPCTHRASKSLELRRPGDLSSGFRVAKRAPAGPDS